VYAVFGSAKRDPEGEQVLMFFENPEDRAQFIEALPGFYRCATLTGVTFDELTVVVTADAS
jgi:hypothetical protein